LSRGARIYAEVEGYGSSNDAFDMVASEESGRGPALAMGMALRKAALAPELVGYINAHGTGTPLNDRVETVAVKRVFGEHARALAISSTKSMTGHMMGAAGAAEAVFTVLALEHQAPPSSFAVGPDSPSCEPSAAARLCAGHPPARTFDVTEVAYACEN
jgi:3-oxoacyl-[acyl-carrier-protein] synthase II